MFTLIVDISLVPLNYIACSLKIPKLLRDFLAAAHDLLVIKISLVNWIVFIARCRILSPPLPTHTPDARPDGKSFSCATALIHAK